MTESAIGSDSTAAARTKPYPDRGSRWAGWLLRVFALLYALPLVTHAAWWTSRSHAASWSRADWSSAGLLAPAASDPVARVHVFCARTGRWRGAFAQHCWIAFKEAGAIRYTRYDKVGWGRPVRENGYAADARWFSNIPTLVATVEGEQAAALIPKIRAAVASYPHGDFGGYRMWPGPNSNSFITHVLAAIPEARIALPATAIGKDYRGNGLFVGPSVSGTGVQLSLFGLAGLTLAAVEGLEVNLFGVAAGLDLARPALKLPGWGRVGP